MSVMVFAAAICFYLLPETSGRPLPSTMHDAVMLERWWLLSSSFFLFVCLIISHFTFVFDIAVIRPASSFFVCNPLLVFCNGCWLILTWSKCLYILGIVWNSVVARRIKPVRTLMKKPELWRSSLKMITVYKFLAVSATALGSFS